MTVFWFSVCFLIGIHYWGDCKATISYGVPEKDKAEKHIKYG